MSYTGQNIEFGIVANDLFSPAIHAAEASLAAFEGRLTSFSNRLSGLSLQSAGIVGLAAAFAVMGKQAAQVEQNVANLNAVLRATPQQLAAIRSQGLQLSQGTIFTDAAILQAQRQLAKANYGPQSIIRQTPQVLDLASATFSDPAQAASTYVAAQKTFQRGVQDSKETVDILAQAVDSSVGSLGDFQVAFKQIGPVANAAHMSLRETATAIADLQNAGLRGDTGTAIKTMLARIEAPSRQARAEIESLGLSFYTAGGRLKSFEEIADELHRKTVGLTDERRNESLTRIFGTRGVRIADVFAEEGGQGLRGTAQHMADIGSASEIAREKLDTLQGSFHQLSSSLNVIAVQGGTAFNPAVRSVAELAKHIANVASSANSLTGNLGGQVSVGGLAVAGEALVAGRIGGMVDAKRAEAARVAAEQERIYATEMQRRLLANQKIEAIEAEHQARMAEIAAEGQARMLANPSASPSRRLAMQAETAAAMAEQETRFVQRLTNSASPLNIVAAPNLKAQTQGAASKVGLALGEIALPVILALTAKELIVDPLLDAVVKRMAGDDFKNLSANISVRTQLTQDENTSPLSYYRDQLQQIERDRRKAEEEVRAYEASRSNAPRIDPGAGISNPISRRFGPGGPTDLVDDKVAKERYEQAKRVVAEAKQAQAQIEQTIKNTPGATEARETDRLSEITNEVARGRLSVEDAIKVYTGASSAVDTYGNSASTAADRLRDAGKSQQEVNDTIADGIKHLKGQGEATKQQAILDAELTRTREEQATSLRNLGVPDLAIRQAVYGEGDAQAIADAKSLVQNYQQAAKAVDEFNKSMAQRRADASAAMSQLAASTQQDIGSVVRGIDLSKGASSLADAADGLQSIQRRLALLGQSNPAIDGLAALATTFRDIADAEDRASAAMRGYLLTLGNTDRYLGQIGQVQSKFDQLLDAAYGAKLRGNLTPAQRQLLDRQGEFRDALGGAQDRLLAAETPDFLNMMRNLPAWERFDEIFRNAVAKAGGGTQIAFDVKDNTAAVISRLKEIEQTQWETTIRAVLAPGPGTPGYGSGIYPGGRSPYDDQYGTPLTGVTAGSAINRPSGLPMGGPGGGGAINFADYQRVLSNYPGSPIASKDAFDTLVSVADQMGVDARMLMAVMQTESGYGANAGRIGQFYNYGGMGVNDRGYGFDSGVHATDGGPEYAGYPDYKSFLMDIAGWIRQNGTSFSNYQTADQGQGKGSAYAYLQSQMAAGPGGAAFSAAYGMPQRWVSPLDAYTVTQGPFTQGSHAGLGAYDLAANTGTPVRASGAGLVIRVERDKGDGTGYGNSVVVDYGGGINARYGHFSGTNVSQGQRVGPGDLLGSVGSTGHSTGPHLHFEVTLNGKEVDPSSVGFDFLAHAMGVSPGGAPGGVGTAGSSSGPRAPIAMLRGGLGNVVGGIMSDLGTEGAAQLSKMFSPIVAAQTTLITAQHRGNDPTRPIGSEEQLDINQESLNRSLDILVAMGRATLDLKNGTGDVAADMQRIADAAGPVGPFLMRQFQIETQIAATTEKIKSDQTAIKDLERQHASDLAARHIRDVRQAQEEADRQYDRQRADNQRQRGRQLAQWAREDIRIATDYAYQQWQKSANDQYTVGKLALDDLSRYASRQFEDQADTSTRQHTLRSRQLEDQIRAAEKLATEIKNGNSALDVYWGGIAKRAGDPGQKRYASEQLAIQRDFEGRQANSQTDQLTLIKEAQIAESRFYEDQQYNIAQSKKLSDRSFEDQMVALDRWHQTTIDGLASAQQAADRFFENQERGLSRTQAIDDWNHQDAEQWLAYSHDNAMRRQQEIDYQADQSYQTNLTAAQQVLADDQAHLAALQEQSAQVDGVLALWSQVASVAGAAANDILAGYGVGNAGSAAAAAASAAASAAAPSGYLNGQQVGGGAIRRLGGYAGGIWDSPTTHLALVGERGPELAVIGRGTSILPTSFLSLLAGAQGQQGARQTVVHLNLGDVAVGLSDEDRREIKEFVAAKIDRAMRGGGVSGFAPPRKLA